MDIHYSDGHNTIQMDAHTHTHSHTHTHECTHTHRRQWWLYDAGHTQEGDVILVSLNIR